MNYAPCMFIAVSLLTTLSLKSLTQEDVFPNRSTQTFDSRSRPSNAALKMVANNQFSTTALSVHTTVHLPSATNLFPDHANLQTKFNDFITALGDADNDVFEAKLSYLSDADKKKMATQKNNFKTFIPKFSRLHFLVLYEIYMYLMKIYANCNLCTTDNMDEFLKGDSKTTGFFLNQKTMLINHMINLIEAQTNEFVRQKWPTFNRKTAGIIGPHLMKLESGADIGYMVRDLEADFVAVPGVSTENQKRLQTKQTTYLTTFGKYLSLFKEYTSDLLEENPETGLTKFTAHAERIGKLIEEMHQGNSSALNNIKAASKNLPTTTGKNFKPNPQASAQTQIIIDTLRKLPRINPPLFFYNEEVLRSLRVIPHIAKNIPATSAHFGWPAQYVVAAQQGTKIQTASGNPYTTKGYENGVPIAEMFDANLNKVTKKEQAQYMIVNIPTANKIYQQQLLQQPDWMGNKRGIMNMLRACLGDFTALMSDPDLIKEEILDPCTMHVIYQGAQAVDGKAALGIPATLGTKVAQQCKDFINMLKPGSAVPTNPIETGESEIG